MKVQVNQLEYQQIVSNVTDVLFVLFALPIIIWCIWSVLRDPYFWWEVRFYEYVRSKFRELLGNSQVAGSHEENNCDDSD
jgi:hypothetical protein